MSDDNTDAQASDDYWHLTIFKNRAAREKKELVATDKEFADELGHRRAPKKEDLPLIKAAAFGNKRTKTQCLRNNGNVIAIYGIEVDYDGEEMPVSEAAAKLRQAGLRAIIVTSPSHTAEKPRWRIYLRTSRNLLPEERGGLVSRVNGVLGGGLAAESWTLSQGFYLGGIDGNPDHHVALIEGNRFIDDATDLDDGAIGKPGTCPNGDWNSEGTGRVDVAALLAAIRAGESYHPAELQLIGLSFMKGSHNPMLRRRCGRRSRKFRRLTGTSAGKSDMQTFVAS